MTKIQDYRSRFGFQATPFTRELQVKHRFALPFFDEAIDALLRALDARMSCAIIAPAGTGKTSVLRELLRRDDLEDVARRLAHCATLRTLSREEVGRYVEHRCTVVGAGEAPFDDASIDALFEIGRGNLRATDQLARKALEVASDQDHDMCEPVHVAQARKLPWP